MAMIGLHGCDAIAAKSAAVASDRRMGRMISSGAHHAVAQFTWRPERLAERFERFVALSASPLIAIEGGLLAPKACRDPLRSRVMPRTHTTVWAHPWEADLEDLIEAYGWVMTKMAQRGIKNQARKGRSSSTRSNLASGSP